MNYGVRLIVRVVILHTEKTTIFTQRDVHVTVYKTQYGYAVRVASKGAVVPKKERETATLHGRAPVQRGPYSRP